MAQAFKCDICGKLIGERASASCSVKIDSNQTYHFRLLTLSGDQPDLCLECMQKTIKNLAIRGGE